MNENFPVYVGEQPHIRKKPSKTRRRAALVAVIALILVAAAAFLLLTDKDSFLSAFVDRIRGNDRGLTDGETPKSSESADVPDAERNIYSFDYSAVPENAVAVIPVDMTPVAEQTFSPVALPRSAGRVLVISTRPFERYLENDAAYVDTEYAFTGVDHTTGGVGEYLASKLKMLGVDAAYFPLETSSAVGAYSAAAAAIAEYMKENDVGYVIDVGRSALIGDGGEVLRPIVSSGDAIIAQTAIVAAKDGVYFEARGGNAATLAESMNALSPKAAYVEITDGVLNQNTSAVFITARIGACGNTYAEAIGGASVMAEALADLIK